MLDRRQFLAASLGAGAAWGLSACAPGTSGAAAPAVSPTPRASASATGTARQLNLRAQAIEVDLGGTIAETWAYGPVPGEPLRATAGDLLRIDFANDLPVATSVHWHGLAIRNDMDGVPNVTTPETPAGGTFQFEFVVPDSGTHWFHPHHGLQLDRGLYAPLIIEDPAEPGDYDIEWVVVLDDWTDGVGPSPEQILADLTDPQGQRGMGMGMMSSGDVEYPLYLVNGRAPSDPGTLAAKPGQRVRMRIINAAADTIFTVALADHDFTVTHSDGFAVEPVTGTAIVLGMGERYDAIVTLGDGVFPFVAEPLGKRGLARALIRTGSGAVPAEDTRPAGLDAEPLSVVDLRAAESSKLEAREPDTGQDVVLSQAMGGYIWTINGRTYADTIPLTVREGEFTRLRIRNMSMMPHPVHVHGHSFQVGPAGSFGPRKDTVLLPSHAGVDVDVAAVNPGSWMVHCHNGYHAEAGMMTRLEYT